MISNILYCQIHSISFSFFFSNLSFFFSVLILFTEWDFGISERRVLRLRWPLFNFSVTKDGKIQLGLVFLIHSFYYLLTSMTNGAWFSHFFLWCIILLSVLYPFIFI